MLEFMIFMVSPWSLQMEPFETKVSNPQQLALTRGHSFCSKSSIALVTYLIFTQMLRWETGRGSNILNLKTILMALQHVLVHTSNPTQRIKYENKNQNILSPIQKYKKEKQVFSLFYFILFIFFFYIIYYTGHLSFYYWS